MYQVVSRLSQEVGRYVTRFEIGQYLKIKWYDVVYRLDFISYSLTYRWREEEVTKENLKNNKDHTRIIEK